MYDSEIHYIIDTQLDPVSINLSCSGNLCMRICMAHERTYRARRSSGNALGGAALALKHAAACTVEHTCTSSALSGQLSRDLACRNSMKILFIATLAVALHLCTAHVRLTFPPARLPDYDFLDNVRTGGPCGVPGK